METMRTTRLVRRARYWLPWLVLSCALWADVASALSRNGGLDALRRTTWTGRDGAPTGISALVQTSDGYLWIGSNGGLFRFDGIRFEQASLPLDDHLSSLNIWSLYAPPSGGLWIGFTFGGVAFLKDGALVAYAEKEGLPPGSVKSFAVDDDGTLWAGTTTGLATFDGSRWHRVGAERGYTATQVETLFVDSAGTLWAASRDGVFAKSRNDRLFQPVPLNLNDGDLAFAESPTGDVWLTNGQRLRRLATSETPRRNDPRSSARLTFDRDGAMWLSQADGTRRIAHPELLPRETTWAASDALLSKTSPRDGPSQETDSLQWVLEDHEGNVWATPTSGLTRFSESNVARATRDVRARIVAERASDAAVVAGDGGETWVGNRFFKTFGLRGDDAVAYAEPELVSCAIRADDGTLWFGGRKGLWKRVADRFEPTPLPRGTDGFEVQAMAQDRSGDLWVSIVRKGVFRLHRGEWTTNGGLDALPAITAVSLATDGAGRVWFGYTEGRVAVLDGGSVRFFAGKDRLRVGNVTALYGKRSHVWVGGELGLALLDGDGFRTVVSDEVPLRGVTGIVESSGGDLWVNSSAGIVHFAATQTRRIVDEPAYAARAEVFNAQDGVDGGSARLRPLPTAIEGTDGLLWFLTDTDLYTIDPAHLHRNTIVPSVVIESLVVGDRTYRPVPDLTFEKGTTSVRISYVGLSLTAAQKVRYRYRLEPSDRGWQDAQQNREAFYTDLSPGKYRFRVIAANNDGIWNETGAIVEFVVPPTFVQTPWFVLLCVLGTSLVVWLAIRFRVRQVAARMRGRFEERMAERERIARELHDTLLQSTQGLVLNFQAVANRIVHDDPNRGLLDEALARADAVIAEGRERVFDLRVSTASQADLAEALASTGAELVDGGPVTFRCVVDGHPRDLRPVVRDETYRIGREALLNAFRHARASSIEIEVVFSDQDLRLRIRDDGVGIDDRTVRDGARDHWGMQGMRERAENIGASLEIWSRPGAGTEIDLTIDAKRAYLERAPRPRWWATLRRFAADRT